MKVSLTGQERARDVIIERVNYELVYFASFTSQDLNDHKLSILVL